MGFGKVGGGMGRDMYSDTPKFTKGYLPKFCPEEFRAGVIERFRIHLHRHPRIPENDKKGTHFMAEKIHHRCVQGMYDFCWSNGLAQVWAYMWN